MKPIPLVLALLCLTRSTLYAQDAAPAADKLFSFPGKLMQGVKQQTSRMDEQLTRQTLKYLQRLEKQEQKIQRKLSRFDPAAAQKLFAGSEAKYTAFADKLKNETGGTAQQATGQYLPYLDSLKGSMTFLQQKQLPGSAQALAQVNQLQNKLQDADDIKQFIRERKQQIANALASYTQLPAGIKNSFAAYKEEGYYYAQQVREYKDIFNDPDKLEGKMLSLLNRLPVFQSFMKEHSQLAGLFSLPGGYADAQSVAGLQTKDQVSDLIVAQLGATGPNQVFQQQVQSAQTQLGQFKNKLSQLGSGSGDMDMPDFKPDNQKTKTFLKRLEYGTNLQTVQASYFFPATTDMALSVGYKLNDKSTVGIGASYKMGWGNGIQHIALSSQGAGLRSYADIKLKGSFYASGGFEYNYQPALISNPELSAWSYSGLAGISKIVSMKTKVFKKTKLQLLWDFLSYQQRPVTQPIKFRVGYSF